MFKKIEFRATGLVRWPDLKGDLEKGDLPRVADFRRGQVSNDYFSF